MAASGGETIVHLPPFEPAPADPPVRFGILGTASIAERRLVPIFQQAKGARLAAVASRDPAKAREKALAWGCEPREGYQALLDDPDIDAVYIPLPNGLHAEWCERALDAGKMVLCEKSLVASPADLRRVREAVERSGGWLEETFQYRFHPLTERARELVRSGGLGAIRSAEAVFQFELQQPGNIRWDAALGGGASFDLGCYCVSMLRLLLDAEPASAKASGWEWRDSPTGPVDVSLSGELIFPGGVAARVAFSFSRPFDVGWKLEGENGTLRSECDFAYNVHDGRPFQELLLEKNGIGSSGGSGRQKIRPRNDINSYGAMVEECCRRWRGGEPARWGVADAADNLAVLWTLIESARRGGLPLDVADFRA